ncbi:MAG TPA: chemical-damaging agent resistance protein C, partial [Bacteroidetes bacterium]|nr:chemical-damaging agent resistance protein C [Bacteroidota bacterium]
TSLIVAELYRKGDEWKFKAVGQGFKDGLAQLGRFYGLNV